MVTTRTSSMSRFEYVKVVICIAFNTDVNASLYHTQIFDKKTAQMLI